MAPDREGNNVAKKSEFLISKIDGSIQRTSDYGLVSFSASAIIGLIAVFLGLVALLPSGLIVARSAFLVVVAFLVGLLVWFIRELNKMAAAKKRLLRKWRQEVFFRQAFVDSHSEVLVKKKDDWVDSVEDAGRTILNTGCYSTFDKGFMEIIAS